MRVVDHESQLWSPLTPPHLLPYSLPQLSSLSLPSSLSPTFLSVFPSLPLPLSPSLSLLQVTLRSLHSANNPLPLPRLSQEVSLRHCVLYCLPTPHCSARSPQSSSHSDCSRQAGQHQSLCGGLSLLRQMPQTVETESVIILCLSVHFRLSNTTFKVRFSIWSIHDYGILTRQKYITF